MKEVESGAESRIKAAASKAMEEFWAFAQFLDEKANFAFDAYDEWIKSIRNKVAAQYPELDLGILDEFLGLEKGEVVVDTSTQDAPATVP